MNEKVTILIPTRFNSRYPIELCLETIRKYTIIPYKMLIGDSGADEETRAYLDVQPDIKVVHCPDQERPKDFLARKVKTPFFLILHDDSQILREGWLFRRLEIMEKKKNVGVLGVLSYNYRKIPVWKRSIVNSCVHKRFFPFAMMVRKDTQEELDLYWGIVGNGHFAGFDTGAIAYLQFLRQKKWKFQRFEIYDDVKHWNYKTWALKEKHKYRTDIDEIISDRDRKIASIRRILENKSF